MKTERDAGPDWQSLLEQLPGCRLLIDDHYRIVATNARYHRCCGAGERESVVGRHCYEVSHGYDAPCDQRGEACPWSVARASGRPERCVHVHHTSQGVEHVDVEVIPLLDATGHKGYFMERMDMLAPAAPPGTIVGRDPSFLKALELVRLVAPSDTSVLMLGETGTGKEVLARMLHDLSTRAAQPFVVVDCAGLAETLFESELFGHEKGAFTGASARKPGLVEAAAGGTLFVDEIGDIPQALQVKLLRVLETGLFRRVGSTEMQRTGFRLVAATHRDLSSMVAAGSFRSDLYYRVSTFPITVPSLRERPLDVADLARSLLARLRPAQPPHFTAEAMQALVEYDYPGNVRELRNIIERGALLAGDGEIDLCHLPEAVAAADRASNTLSTPVTLEDVERQAVREALAQTGGNRRAQAASLGVSERTLYRKLRQARTENRR